MDTKIQELTDKIYKEGVEKGNDEAVAMLDAYFAAQFEGGRHEHRIEKMAIPCGAAGDAAK